MPSLARFCFGLVWTSALVLSVSLFAMSTSTLSRGIFVLAALVAFRQVVYGPIELQQDERERQRKRHPQPPGGPPH